MSKPTIEVTRFHMRNTIDGHIEVLIEHQGKWLTVFGAKGPGPVARDQDQLIDHMIHAGGVQNLIDHGNVHGLATAREVRKPDRRTGKSPNRRRSVRRQDDKTKARLKR